MDQSFSSQDVAARVPEPRSFLDANFLLLVQGTWVNQVGTQIALIATTVWLRRSTNSASLIGLLATISALPIVLFSPWGGALADRWFRRDSLIAWDLCCGLVSCGLMLLVGSTSWAVAEIIIGIFLGALFLSSANAFTSPAFNALIPDIVAPVHLQKAMAFTQASSLIAIICGQALGGLLVGRYPPHVLFGIDAASYFFSAVAECFVRVPSFVPKARQAGNLLKILWDDIHEGLMYIWQRRGMRTFLLVSIPMNLFTSPIFVFLPFYTTNALGQPLSRYGYLLAIFSLGLLIGYALAGRFPIPPSRISPMTFGSVVVNALICIVLSSIHIYWLAAILLIMFGCFSGMVTLICLNALITHAEPDKRGRVSAILVMIAQGITPLAMSFVGMLGDVLHGNVRPIYAGCGIVLLILGSTLSFNSDLRRFFEGRPD